MKKLNERVQQLGNSLPLMEDREKGELVSLFNKRITIKDYGFLKDGEDGAYVAFIIEEDKQHFYFGGSVLTSDILELDVEGYYHDIVKEGLPVNLSSRVSKKSGKTYTSVKYL